MAVPTVNLVIEQGTDFARTYSLKRADNTPLDLSPYTFEAHMFKSRSAIQKGMENNMISMGTTFGIMILLLKTPTTIKRPRLFKVKR